MILTPFFLDSFQRANEDPLDPANWVQHVNTSLENLEISNNECETTVNLGQQDGTAGFKQTLPSDSFIQVNIQRIRKLSVLVLYIGNRVTDASHFQAYRLDVFNLDGTNYFFDVGMGDAATATVFNFTGEIPFTFTPGDSFALALVGTTLYVLQNGKPLYQGDVSGSPLGLFTRNGVAIQIALVNGPPFDSTDLGIINFQTGSAIVSSLQFTQLALDTFNRANENPLGNGQWTTYAAFGLPLQIVSNVCEAVSPNVFGASQYTGIVWPNDQWAEIKVTAIAASSDIALAIRADSGFNNYLEVDIQVGAGVKVIKGVAGTQTTLATFPAPSVGDVYRLAAIGTTWYLFQNGNQIGSGQIGATPASGNVVLINVYSSVPSDTTVDNFSGGSVINTPDTVGNGVCRPAMIYGRAPNGVLSAVTTDGNGNIDLSGQTPSVVDTIGNGIPLAVMVYGRTPSGVLQAVQTDGDGHLT